MAEQVLLREIGTDGGKVSFSDLKQLQKKVSGNGKVLDLSSKLLEKMLGRDGIPLCHELFISSRYATGNESLK